MAAKKDIKMPQIIITPSAQKIRSLALRNEAIINNVWLQCIKKTGAVPQRIKVEIDLLDEMEYGFYDHNLKTIYLNVLLTPHRVVKILLHELCHASQYHTRRMRDQKVKNRWGTWFEGEFRHTGGASFDYWGAPWEVEARHAETMSSGIIESTKNWSALVRRPYWLTES